MPSVHTNNFPESGRGLGHVTPTIFGIRSNVSPKLLQLETSNLACGFVWGMPSRRANNFPWKWAWHWPLFRGRFRSAYRPASRTSVVTITIMTSSYIHYRPSGVRQSPERVKINGRSTVCDSHRCVITKCVILLHFCWLHCRLANLGGQWRLLGAIVCVITKIAILM